MGYAVLLALTALTALNGAIRALGGSPSLLSLRHLGDKVSAISAYFIHLPRHAACPCDKDLRGQVRAMATLYGVPPAFALAIAESESRLRPHVVSRTGAMGIMQLMPLTARSLGVVDAFDPRENIHGGVRYLAGLLRRYRGDYRRAAAAYNVGLGRVPRRGKLRLPRETRRYVRRVMRRFWATKGRKRRR